VFRRSDLDRVEFLKEIGPAIGGVNHRENGELRDRIKLSVL